MSKTLVILTFGVAIAASGLALTRQVIAVAGEADAERLNRAILQYIADRNPQAPIRAFQHFPETLLAEAQKTELALRKQRRELEERYGPLEEPGYTRDDLQKLANVFATLPEMDEPFDVRGVMLFGLAEQDRSKRCVSRAAAAHVVLRMHLEPRAGGGPRDCLQPLHDAPRAVVVTRVKRGPRHEE